MLDILGNLLAATPHFRGKDRLTELWVRRHRGRSAIKELPGDVRVQLDLGVPYEASAWLGLDDRQDLALIRSLLGPGDVFVDCGANIGIWTITAAIAVGDDGCVHAFEPHPEVFRKLQRNVSLSGVEQRVRLYRSAVGSRRGRLWLQIEDLHDMSRIVDAPTESSIEVDVITLDSVLQEEDVRGVKLDVEGFELQALQGAKGLLTNERPWLIVEFNSVLAGTRRLGDWPVHELLVGTGYACRLTHARTDDQAGVLSPDWQTTLGHCNLLYEPIG